MEPKTAQEALDWMNNALESVKNSYNAFMRPASKLPEYERLKQAEKTLEVRRKIWLKLQYKENNGGNPD